MTVVKPNGCTAILAAPGTYPRPVRRSEVGANPTLSRNCDASAPAEDEPGRLLFAVELSPRRKGGSRGTARRATSLRFNAEVFYVQKQVRRGSGRGSSRSRGSGRRLTPGGDADPDRLALTHRNRGSVRDRRGQAGRGGRQPVELPEERSDDEALG